MRYLLMTVWLSAALVGSAVGQAAPKKKSAIGKIAGKLVDTAITNVAAGAVDSLLGTGGSGTTTCPAGTVATRAAPAPTVGSAVISQAKKRLLGAKKDPAATTTAPACIPAGGAMPGVPVDAVAMMAAQSQAQSAAMAAGLPSAGSIAKGMAAATPVGLAVAAAPTAIKAAKAFGGLLGGKGQTKESMIKDLAKGRLILKGIKFIASSDALEDPIDDDIAILAEALSAMEGKYVLNMPAEVKDKTEPDTVIARRRLDKLVASLQVAGISPERLAVVGSYPPGLDPKAKGPKPGEARVEVLPLPKDFPKPE